MLEGEYVGQLVIPSYSRDDNDDWDLGSCTWVGEKSTVPGQYKITQVHDNSPRIAGSSGDDRQVHACLSSPGFRTLG